MKPAMLLALLAPAAALAESQQQPATASAVSSDFAHNSPTVSLAEMGVRDRDRFVPVAGLDSVLVDEAGKLAARHVLQARSEGSLGQTPWIGMAIGLTFTALAAVMLG
ncbi:hypothetical protein N7499_010949 [Penicillium canescens]|jgi:hypothetical protein|uniref:Uncharacterized protein n=1 Tax=Penicillium canescens TaxID=5083 RepID=A0AAD6IJE2_PENCN|nr:uncharacterized protein N7446_006240 [Penicillium canescens]KAJ5990435.1 hypothetical protein N7522_010642 [Penicillium canescens]KAJ6051606.1 hypothetical protein N7460_002140 [Penicillium canescens]KAJ6062120.1 hypothetical protein N7446_006240 [Penicillium canescens]KAJ6065369.1 hypothetical protein N7444_001022 [Penicillium canescens]KAJ6069062.1 hypothetical protein N7499_010949 [Penicillium canescens]